MLIKIRFINHISTQKGYHSFVAFANMNYICNKAYNCCPCLSKSLVISNSKIIFQIPSISNALPLFGVLGQLNVSNKGEACRSCSIGTVFAYFQ